MSNKISKEASLLLLDEMEQEQPRLEKIKKLLDDGADINFQSQEDGYTALMLAVDADDEDMVSFLLGHGADTSIKNKHNESAVTISNSHSYIKLLLRGGELIQACIDNDVSAINAALSYGADVNARGVGGNTALMFAVEHGCRDAVDLLLKCGADTSLLRDDGCDVYGLVTDQLIYATLISGAPLNSDEISSNNVNDGKYFKEARLKSLSARRGNEFDISDLEFDDHYPMPDENQIDAVESHFGHPLPALLKSIYQKYNGGHPGLNRYGEYGEHIISHFYSVQENQESPSSIWWAINSFSSYLGAETLPFAEDNICGVFYLKWVDGLAQVWLFRCGEEALDEEDYYVDEDDTPISLSYVCDSLDVFLDGLYAAD